jgi:DNA-binding response OmpR family regulator
LKLRILSIGHSASLLKLRNTTIQQAGYQVTTTKETALLLELAERQDFDAIVMCSSIPLLLREHLAHQLKRMRPSVPLIIICAEEERQHFLRVAEAVIAPPGTRQPLVEAIGRAIHKAGTNTKTA